jgi:hypothetical protein
LHGDLQRARELHRTALSHLDSVGDDPLARLAWVQTELLLLWCEGEFRAAGKLAEDALAIARGAGVSSFNSLFFCLRAWMALAHGDVATAQELLGRVRTVALASPQDRGQYANTRALEALALGDAAACARWLTASDREADALDWTLARCLNGGLWLMRALALGDPPLIRSQLAELDARLALAPGQLFVTAAGLLKASARIQLGELDLVELKVALRRARSAGLLGLIWCGSRETIAPLVKVALEHGIEVDYAIKLMRAYEIAPGEEALLLAGWPWPVRVRVLGQVEIMVADTRVEFGRKQPTVPLALLKLLVAAERPVSQAKLTAALWPGYGLRARRGTLDTAVYRLRKLLGSETAIRSVNGTLALDPKHCWSDVRALKLVCDRIAALPDARKSEPARERLESALRDLHRGPLAVKGESAELLRAAEQIEQRSVEARARLIAPAKPSSCFPLAAR